MIGVFDSGIGGLTVHRALVEKLPSADFIYLADQAHTPYGVRPAEEIVALTRQGCITLFDAGASLVVLACNTAAAVALRRLQREWLPEYRAKLGRPVNVIGLIVPTIEAATGLNWKAAATRGAHPETIGIFATAATMRANVYAEEIHKRRPDITVTHEACTDLARMIEAGAARDDLKHTVEGHVRSLCARIDASHWQAILGCTHYEIVGDLFRQFLPQQVRLIHQPSATAAALARYLAAYPEYDGGSGGTRRFMTTAHAEQNLLAREFWGAALHFEVLRAA